MPSENMMLCDLSGSWPQLMWVRDSVDNAIPTHLENGITHYLQRHGRSVVLQQMELSSLISRGQINLIGSLPHSWLGIVLPQKGKPCYCIILQTYRGVRFTHAQRNFLDQLAATISRALARLQLQQQQIAANVAAQAERQSQQSLEVMCQITELCQSELSLAELYQRFHQLLGKLMPAEHFTIALRREVDSIEFVFATNAHLEELGVRKSGKGLTEYAMSHSRPILLTQDEIEQLFSRGDAQQLGGKAACWLGAPLNYAGEVLGALVLQDYQVEHAYGKPELQLIGYLAHQIANVIGTRRTQQQLASNQQMLERAVKQRTAELEHEINERRRIETQLRHDTLHDDLTGLPNRAMIMQRLNQVLSVKQRDNDFTYALMFLDLNRFKVINDSLGHLTGDSLLRQVAQRLNSCLRGFDTVARLGGDEFAILLEHLSCDNDAIQTANRINATLARPFYIGDEEVYSGASIGITFGSQEYHEPAELLRDADVAMYRAKQTHSKLPVVFDASMRAEAQHRMKLENELQRALEFEQFEVYYQPVWILASEQLCGFEALVRWRHPERGILLPGEFLPLMEETRQILELDRWVLNHACNQFVQWQAKYPRLERVGISVNLSAEWFSRSDSLDVIMHALNHSGLNANQLLLEITERSLQHHPENAAQILRQLRHIGVRSMMDDFGTGYASLSYLHQLPLDVVKIDSSFIGHMDGNNRSSAVVRAIFTLCQELGINVNAEGIDKPQQIEQLRALGCQYGQGYHLGHPMPAAQVSHFLAGKAITN
ncbi:EAL domain-containing protein [uncultured Ferrimonas sp.]|uniref:putative bifunctional diguanylate cyclase/phosphodiesterase n=1 Tax=uncultured Ferrimonas sp. TaxID=432640 RepID=UPI00262EBA6A|nr:EAL domain-containing protein [uncultured Ferrimonas sp.]